MAHPPADPGRAAVVRRLAEGRTGDRGPLLPILHAVQAEFGWVADQDLPIIADVLNLSRADVHGVVSFYHDFRRTPPPAHAVRLCRGEACQAVGAEALLGAVSEAFADNREVEVGEVFCLGNCALGPSGFLDGKLMGRLTPESVAAALTGAQR